MAYHPGVTFYLLSWLALALTGYPIASGENFFSTVLAHVEDYHRMILHLGASVGAAGVFFLVRAPRQHVIVGETAAGRKLWVVSASAILQMLMSVGMDAFAMLINALLRPIVGPLPL